MLNFYLKNILPTGVIVMLSVGCASQAPTPKPASAPAATVSQEEEEIPFETRVAKLRLGMSKSQVTAIMDDEGQSLHRSLSDQGNVETVLYAPNFGQRYSTALKRQFSLGFAGRSDPNGTVLMFKNGRLSSVSSQ